MSVAASPLPPRGGSPVCVAHFPARAVPTGSKAAPAGGTQALSSLREISHSRERGRGRKRELACAALPNARAESLTNGNGKTERARNRQKFKNPRKRGGRGRPNSA